MTHRLQAIMKQCRQSAGLLVVIALMAFSAIRGTAQAPAAGSEPSQQPQSVIDRLGAPSSGISVTAPEGLLQRAAAPTAEVVDEVEPEGDPADLDIIPKPRTYKSAGFRVQVYADNNVRNAKAQARQRERALSQAFPMYTTYVTYASPYWRLRVGDFTSQYDAERAATEIRKAFPAYAKEVRVVRDHVNATR